MTSTDWTGYLIVPGFEAELRAELGADAVPAFAGATLWLAPGPPRPAAWAQDVWPDLRLIRFESIGDAARQLRALGRNWAMAPCAPGLNRRAALIRDKLPHVSAKPLTFPQPAPTAPMGGYCLISAAELWAAPVCLSPFPLGEAQLVEDKVGPPSRAYLKLQEALTLMRRSPAPGERCIDLGACPGGWTFVLASLGAQVDAVDKAPLDPKVAASPLVTERLGSAFALDPAAEPAYDWVVSDIICYPDRLTPWMLRWLAAQPQANYVVTVKFQGATDMAPIAPLAAVPGARLLHLTNNKHELTWLRPAPILAPAAQD